MQAHHELTSSVNLRNIFVYINLKMYIIFTDLLDRKKDCQLVQHVQREDDTRTRCTFSITAHAAVLPKNLSDRVCAHPVGGEALGLCHVVPVMGSLVAVASESGRASKSARTARSATTAACPASSLMLALPKAAPAGTLEVEYL